LKVSTIQQNRKCVGFFASEYLQSHFVCRNHVFSKCGFRVKHGKVLVVGNRQAGGGNKTFAVVSESTGTVEGQGDTFLDGASPTHMFIDSATIGAWGATDCPSGGNTRMTGGDQLIVLPTTGGAATAGLMTGEHTIQGCDADHVVTHGSMLSTRADPISATTLDRTGYSPHTVTAISGGDAFFPTKDYNKHIVQFFAQNILYNTDLEWRLNLGDPGSAPTFQTAWFAYGETTANVMKLCVIKSLFEIESHMKFKF
jgi:hypothetical protein